MNVTKINIINKQNRTKLTRGRKVKVSGFKKAIITLKKGQSIDLTTEFKYGIKNFKTLHKINKRNYLS